MRRVRSIWVTIKDKAMCRSRLSLKVGLINVCIILFWLAAAEGLSQPPLF